jgi:VanZ family protein
MESSSSSVLMPPLPRKYTEFSASRLLLIALAFGFFIAYGSLVPLQFEPRPFSDAVDAFRSIPYLRLGVASRADWVANILLYLPIGFFLTGGLAGRARSVAGAMFGTAVAVSLCLLLAVAVEFAQLFFPPRTVSQNDLIAEAIGTVLGATLWVSFGPWLLGLWGQVIQAGPTAIRALVVLYALAYLAVSLFPYDFLVSPAELSDKLTSPGTWSPLIARSCGGVLSCGVKLFSEALVAAPFGYLLGMAAAASRPLGAGTAFGFGALLGLVIETLQIFLASGTTQGISILTRALGAAWGLSLFRHFRRDWVERHRPQLRLAVLLALPVYFGLLLALNGTLSGDWQPLWRARERLTEVHFLPFYYHYFTSETQALFSALATAGSYAPLGLAAWLIAASRGTRSGAGLTIALSLTAASCVETLKLFVPAKHPDPTNILIAVAVAWLVNVLVNHLAHLSTTPVAATARGARAQSRTKSKGLRLALVGSLVVVTVSGLAGWLIASPEREEYVDESKLPQIPPPEELPLARFPDFHLEHPRLPHPTAADIELLRRANPGFLKDQEKSARGGSGEIHAVALTELVSPGSQDLGALHRRLMEFKFDWRGHGQVKPLAVAYDWLYARWTPTQRDELADKLAEGCEYLINVIRKERLSPYNAILYNSPFQALMACSIALYGEHRRGEAAMAFTADYWKRRVLPVWQQVMGRNGGWHEGGEYVGIGIGQAIYQLPAMWRLATGEDMFRTEPGIRGFLDFLIYRTRPDGTHFRWGDGAFFDRAVPDAISLSIEFRHRAAYTLRPPRQPAPTAWPWGPLGDPLLEDPQAIKELPLAAHFDGLGLLVARSDWSPDATYVTFKAGDNYWSHSHLDQGAFTLYKGGELAIDSGLYGPVYGSEHHMNYTYQTIAHNVVTVTDPEDRVAAPGKEKPRPIANDGGQRRIGSGWGVEAAPIDRSEWEAKRETYHTGSIEHLLNTDDLLVAVADLTPAYTNHLSGHGTFSHRTRRVEAYKRVFGYDRRDDVIVVFDHVRASNSAFRKRWLLHTLNQPSIGAAEFAVTVPPSDRIGHGGGQLRGQVLLPREANINLIGGPGFEFFVDGKNYDEDGKLQDLIRKLGPGRGEPGAWRIEVSPRHDAETDQFLVVMLPSALQTQPTHRVRLIESEGKVGCEVIGPNRTTRWWFSPEGAAVRIEVISASGTSTHDL